MGIKQLNGILLHLLGGKKWYVKGLSNLAVCFSLLRDTVRGIVCIMGGSYYGLI
jgi:hypothetical protein